MDSYSPVLWGQRALGFFPPNSKGQREWLHPLRWCSFYLQGQFMLKSILAATWIPLRTCWWDSKYLRRNVLELIVSVLPLAVWQCLMIMNSIPVSHHPTRSKHASSQRPPNTFQSERGEFRPVTFTDYWFPQSRPFPVLFLKLANRRTHRLNSLEASDISLCIVPLSDGQMRHKLTVCRVLELVLLRHSHAFHSLRAHSKHGGGETDLKFLVIFWNCVRKKKIGLLVSSWWLYGWNG